MTQPPLSIAIKRLETEIGAELFERDRQARAADGRGHRLPG